jgi:predicted outer membrane repeat protein
MYDSSLGNATLTNVTFNLNSADQGGGMYIFASSPTLTNVTFSANFGDYGGGLMNFAGNPLLTNVTFSNNSASSGGAIYNTNGGNPTLKNIILANTINGGDCANNASSLNAASSHNLVEDSLNACGLTNGVNNNIVGQDPNLGTLADNGGFGQTHALLHGSVAINTGTNTGCPATDQRGASRPQGAGCDIGAYEYVSSAVFTKSAPANGATGQSLSPTLFWQTSSGATSYEYCYSSVVGPCTQWHSVGSNTSVTLSGLSPNYTYYWQVRAVASGVPPEANGGTWWSFTTTATSACSWPAYTPPTSATFGDVPMTVGHWNWVERLANSTITAGCGAGNYCPFSEVNRAQMAIFLLRGKHCGSSYTPSAVGDSTGFGDVPLSASYAPWVKQLAAEGITAGCGNGNFCPQQVVNRAQMAIFLLRAVHGATYSPPAVGATTGFSDVPLDATYAAWVKQLAAEGVTAGCGGGNFCPLQNVNRAQMATFLVRAFGLP